MLCFLRRGDLPLHAAAVDVGGEAVLLAAPGYFGKTTLSAGFDAAGYRVLSEDVSCLRLAAEEAAVVPGPAMLRVREDVADRLELPARAPSPGATIASTSRSTPTAAATRRRCRSARSSSLRRGDDGVSLERVEAAAALRDLWPLSFRLPTAEDRARCFEGITELAAGVRIWNLVRPLRIDALGKVVEKIVADA